MYVVFSSLIQYVMLWFRDTRLYFSLANQFLNMQNLKQRFGNFRAFAREWAR